jgi:hypothetical protein
MPGHQPIPRPVDLTDLPNPTPPDLPMPPDRTTVGRAAIALQYVMGDGYERGVEILSNCTPDQLRTIAESASMLADLATTAMLAGVPAGPGLVLGSVGEYASQLTVAEPLPPMMAGACICRVPNRRQPCPRHPVATVVAQGPQIAADTRTLTESTVQGVSAVLALQEDAGGASAAAVSSAD